MKLPLDENISRRLVKHLTDIFPDSLHVTATSLPQPSTDWAIWNFARQGDYVILTQDEDFENIALLRGQPPKVILLRSGNLTTSDVAQLLRSRSELIQEFAKDAEKVLLELY